MTFKENVEENENLNPATNEPQSWDEVETKYGEENDNLNPATKEPQSWDEVETKYAEENEHDVRLDLELCEAFYLSYALGKTNILITL